MRILVVDDDSAISQMLTVVLGDLGHSFRTASNGKEAWALLNQQQFDLVLSDWRMPEMDGLQLCRLIRKSPDPRYLYVILCTGNNQRSDFVEGMEAGADDFVAKPIDIADLRMRIRAAERILNLQKELAAKNVRLERDLNAVSAMQLLLLPPKLDLHKNTRLDWLMIPSSLFAGDMLNYFMVDDRYLVFYQMDVAGHGIPAALRSVMVGRVLTAEPGSPILRGGERSKGIRLARPAQVVSALNQQFLGQWDEYFTIIYGVFDTRTGEARFCQAGHPPPISLKSGQQAVTVGAGGFPVGLWPGMEFEETSILMAPGDRLVLYSDGITDCQNEDGEPYSRDRLAQLLRQNAEAPLPVLIEAVRQDVGQWRGGGDFADDLSMLVLECIVDESVVPSHNGSHPQLNQTMRESAHAGQARAGSMKLELSIESSLTQVRLVRAALAGILNDLDVLDDDIILVELAVSELINNVIEHAYQGDTDRRIDVSITVDSLHLRVTVSDTGIPLPVEQLKKLLEPPQYEASSGPDMRCRGRGLQIIRQAVDSVSFRGARGRNIATLEKRLVTRAL